MSKDSPSLHIGLGTESGATKRDSRGRGRPRSHHKHRGGSARSQTATSRKHSHHRKRGSHKQRDESRRDSGYLPTTVIQPEGSAVCSPTQRTDAAAESPSRPPQPDQAPALSCTGAKAPGTAAQRHCTSVKRHQPLVKLPHLVDEASTGSLGAGMANDCSFGAAVAATEAATGMAATEVVTEAAATEAWPAPSEVAATEVATATAIVPAATSAPDSVPDTTDIITEAATGM